MGAPLTHGGPLTHEGAPAVPSVPGGPLKRLDFEGPPHAIHRGAPCMKLSNGAPYMHIFSWGALSGQVPLGAPCMQFIYGVPPACSLFTGPLCMQFIYGAPLHAIYF